MTVQLKPNLTLVDFVKIGLALLCLLDERYQLISCQDI